MYTIGGPAWLQTRENCGYSHKLVASRSLNSYVSLILLAITCENSRPDDKSSMTTHESKKYRILQLIECMDIISI